MKDKIQVLDKIAEDMAKDAETFDFKTCNHRNVGEYCDKLGAAIAALAGIIKEVIEDGQ